MSPKHKYIKEGNFLCCRIHPEIWCNTCKISVCKDCYHKYYEGAFFGYYHRKNGDDSQCEIRWDTYEKNT